MKKAQLANEKVMYDYLNELLSPVTDTVLVQDTEITVVDEQPVSLHSDEIAQPVSDTTSVETVSNSQFTTTEADQDLIAIPSETIQAKHHADTLEEGKQITEPLLASFTNSVKKHPTEAFQALFFKVAGLTMAVPLTQLGGIHNVTERNHLPGKPEWFDGVMVHREDRFNAVNTALWVMPERYQQVQSSLDYQYLILLENSPWGLMCDTLVNTETLQPDDVKWSTQGNKRRWLAGLVKEKKCALIDVNEMIGLLNQGQDCQG